jgi:hypothetical protein
VAPLCGPRTHVLLDRALLDRGMSQYWLVRSVHFWRYGQVSHSLRFPRLQRLIGPRMDHRLCEPQKGSDE